MRLLSPSKQTVGNISSRLGMSLPDTLKPIDILSYDKWMQLPVTGIYHHLGKPDVAAITLSRQIAPRYPVELSASNIKIGQDVAFVGFPFGWNNTQYDFNNGYPIPFVKAAIVSAFIPKDQTSVVFLDGHNNPGFSGGPIAADHMPRKDPKLGPKIIGVVSTFQCRQMHGQLPSEIGPVHPSESTHGSGNTRSRRPRDNRGRPNY